MRVFVRSRVTTCRRWRRRSSRRNERREEGNQIGDNSGRPRATRNYSFLPPFCPDAARKSGTGLRNENRSRRAATCVRFGDGDYSLLHAPSKTWNDLDSSRSARIFKINAGKEWRDIYQWVLSLNWSRFAALIAGAYVGINVFFAALYSLGGNCVAGMTPGSFPEAFFFSSKPSPRSGMVICTRRRLMRMWCRRSKSSAECSGWR